MAIEDTVRGLVIAGLSQTPRVGFLAGTIVNALWPPSGEDIWGEIQSNVQALINQSLDQFTQQLVTEDLAGLNNVMQDYVTATQDSTGSAVSDNYYAARAQFDGSSPHFMSLGHEILLLPLMAQMANLHLSLLRDGVKFGKSWGWSDHAVADQEKQLRSKISTYTAWVSTWCQNAQTIRLAGIAQGMAFNRLLVLEASDFAHYWPMFDPQTNPGNVTLPTPTREIYAVPVVWNQQPFPMPTIVLSRLSGLELFAIINPDGSLGNLGGVRVFYGPSYPSLESGSTQGTPYVWGSNPGGGIGSNPGNPIVEAGVGGAGVGPNNQGWAVARFKYKDGTAMTAGNPNAAINDTLSFPGHILSNVFVFPPDQEFPDQYVPMGVMFGFRLENAF